VISSTDFYNSNNGPSMNLGGIHARNLGLHASNLSIMSFMTNGENINESKIIEERPMINKSLGKH
jgi:hypothetical protein